MQENIKNEIDINELFIDVFVFLRKKIFIISAFLIAGIIIGIIKHYTGNPKYEVKMTAVSVIENNFLIYDISDKKRYSYYSSEIAVNIINSLQYLIETKNYTELANKLNISNEDAVKIISISTDYLYPVEGTASEEDKNPTNFISITATIIDNKIIKNLQKGIENCIKENTYIKNIISQRKKLYRNMIKHIDNELIKLDSIQRAFIKNPVNNGDIVVVKENSFIVENVKLIAIKELLDAEYKEFTPFTSITDFNHSNSNENTLIKSIAIFGFITLILGFIFIFVISYNKKAKSKMKQNDLTIK